MAIDSRKYSDIEQFISKSFGTKKTVQNIEKLNKRNS